MSNTGGDQWYPCRLQQRLAACFGFLLEASGYLTSVTIIRLWFAAWLIPWLLLNGKVRPLYSVTPLFPSQRQRWQLYCNHGNVLDTGVMSLVLKHRNIDNFLTRALLRWKYRRHLFSTKDGKRCCLITNNNTIQLSMCKEAPACWLQLVNIPACSANHHRNLRTEVIG